MSMLNLFFDTGLFARITVPQGTQHKTFGLLEIILRNASQKYWGGKLANAIDAPKYPSNFQIIMPSLTLLFARYIFPVHTGKPCCVLLPRLPTVAIFDPSLTVGFIFLLSAKYKEDHSQLLAISYYNILDIFSLNSIYAKDENNDHQAMVDKNLPEYKK
jgi:hypothetical protein